jgi:histidinol dehydrogenase
MKIIRYDDVIDIPIKGLENDHMKAAREILADIKSRGDGAIKDYSRQFDGVALAETSVPKSEFSQGILALSTGSLSALEESADRLKQFAEKQLAQLQDFEFEIEPGVITGQRVISLDRVGVYVPGGNYPLVSSLLMGAVPAKVAGVKEVVVCTPPGRDGKVPPAILAAATIAEVDEMYTIGGVQAIGAMAYGTETIEAVDKIVGPGNCYVTAAKKEVFGTVGIDFIAGPSEVMIIADAKANPVWIAADLLAQAEHDTMAVPLLVTDTLQLAQKVQAEVKTQLNTLSTNKIARISLASNGRIILVETMAQAITLANKQAPEHLELHLEAADKYIPQLKHFGSLFIGGYAAEVLGDYSSGLNHTLPTGRAARYSSGLGVRDFVKISTTLKVNRKGIAKIGPAALAMAELEGLKGHVNATGIRLNHGGL